MNSAFRKPLLRRNFSIERLGRKSSINSLAPVNAKHDSDGFEDIDSYFPDEAPSENANVNRTPVKSTNKWKVDPSPNPRERFNKHEEYEVDVSGDNNGRDEYIGNDTYNDSYETHDGIHDTSNQEVVASPDVDDKEIVFKRSVKPRPSLPRLPRKRSLLSDRLILAHDDDMDDEKGRRSARKRFAPLAFWRNEKVVYGRRNSARTPLSPVFVHTNISKGMPVIVDIVKQEELAQASKRHKAHKKKQPQVKIAATGIVRDHDSKEEIETQLALSANMVRGEAVPDAEFKIHTVFVEGGFMSSGVLIFPHGSSKPSRNSSKHALVFYVVEGRFKVNVHKTSFEVYPGCQFHVPRSNQYSLVNVGAGEGRLFFCHCKSQ